MAGGQLWRQEEQGQELEELTKLRCGWDRHRGTSASWFNRTVLVLVLKIFES